VSDDGIVDGWAIRMRWSELLFAHWAVDASAVQRLIPAGLEVDLFEGRCYVGAVPFLMDGVTPRLIPALPRLHAFPELNLRTYVTVGGIPGVWFFSLDAGQKLAVRTARRFFHLPYFDARFEIKLQGDRVSYSAVRTHRAAPAAAFSASYQPTGPVYRSEAGTLDAWLTERYCLYAADTAGRIYRGKIEHEPWPLQPAEATLHTNTLGDWLGIEMIGDPATLHFAKSLDVRAWLVKRA
jgi:uncharacterized protein YqjF (DUF2071 family)